MNSNLYATLVERKLINSQTVVRATVPTRGFHEGVYNAVKDVHWRPSFSADRIIDIEGMDFKVLKSINLNFYKPELICIEIFGSNNANKVKKYLKAKKYFYLKKIGPSYFFRPK